MNFKEIRKYLAALNAYLKKAKSIKGLDRDKDGMKQRKLTKHQIRRIENEIYEFENQILI